MAAASPTSWKPPLARDPRDAVCDAVPRRGSSSWSRRPVKKPSVEEKIEAAARLRQALSACWNARVEEVRELLDQLPRDLYHVRGNLESDKPPWMSFPSVSLVDAVTLGAHLLDPPPPEAARRELLFLLQSRGARFTMPTLYHDFSGISSLQTLAEMGVMLDEIDLPAIMLRGPDGPSYAGNLLLDVSGQDMPWRHRAMLRRLRPPRPILGRGELVAGLICALRAGAQCEPITPAGPEGRREGEIDDGPSEARAHFARVLFGDPADPEAKTVAQEEWAIELTKDLYAAAREACVSRAWQRRRGALLAVRSKRGTGPASDSWAWTLQNLGDHDLLGPVFAFL